MKTVISTLAVISALAMPGHQRAFAQDCNHNEIPDQCDLDCGDPEGPCDIPGCGESTDCNENALPDECDVIGGGGAIVFSTGIQHPQDIVQSAGDYPAGFLVTAGPKRVVRHVSPLGGTVTVFAETRGLPLPIGAVMVPNEFGGKGERLFVAGNQSGPGPDIVVVGADARVEPFAELPFNQRSIGLGYIPKSVGGPAAGKLIVPGYTGWPPRNGRIYLIDEEGEAVVIVHREDALFWTPTLAPKGFGDYAHHVFVSDGSSNKLFVLNLDTNELDTFAEIPRETYYTPGRQMAFSPIGWAQQIDPGLKNESVLVLAVTSSPNAGGPSGKGGTVMVWDQRGRRVAVMTTRLDGPKFEPRGILSVAPDLLISVLTYARLWRVTVEDFAIGDCNENDVPDDCDIAEGFSLDENDNGIPDECEGILCKHVKKFKAKCRRGKLKALVQLIDDRYAGEEVTLTIDEREYPIEIRGKKAKLTLRNQQGETTVTLTFPTRCADPRVVDCG